MPGSDERAPPLGRGVGLLGLGLVLAWLACALWNAVKPMPAGTHVSSLPARLSESQIDFFDEADPPRGLQRAFALVDGAEQMLVIDQSPLAAEMARHLLARKRQRPNLIVVLITDSRNEAYGGTPAQTLGALERSGIIVARVRLDRLRDSNPLYSSLWRLGVAWWNDPFDDVPGQVSLPSRLRSLNLKANHRQIIVGDDGAGGWSSMIMSAALQAHGAEGGLGLQIRGHLAHEIAGSELQLAAWSTDDDRLPAPPPAQMRGMGTIDARFVTEGAIQAAIRDAMTGAGRGDSINVDVHALGDRTMIGVLQRAAARGVQLRILLDSDVAANQAVAGELLRQAGGNLEIRWCACIPRRRVQFVLIEHRNDVWLTLGSADLSRRSLDDLDLEANIELRMPARAVSARAASLLFAKHWSAATLYAAHANESDGLYFLYRVAEATGLPML